jgi:DNA-binding LacI/PurR family transcriptional regulator
MNKARPTLSDIAEKFGISKQAVSRALRDMPDIGQKMRLDIQEHAQEIGYAVNWAARSLATRRSGLLGIGMGSFANPFFQDVTYALSRSIKREGFTPVLVDVEAALETSGGQSAARASDVPLDGLILLEGWYDLQLTEAQIAFLDRSVAPTLYRGNLSSDLVDQVQVDWYAASRTLTRHLIELGHRKIGTIRGVGGPDNVREEDVSAKILGTVDELQAHGIDHDPQHFVRIPTGLPQARDAAANLIARADRPSAIICHTDYLAIGAIRAVTEAGLTVPGDISIAGFNDIELGRFLPISLTTIGHDRAELAEELVKRLAARIRGERNVECFKTQVLHELIPRESTDRVL